MNESITPDLIEYYANKKGISLEEAKYELENSFGYEEYDENTILEVIPTSFKEEILLIGSAQYKACVSNPFKYDYPIQMCA